MHRKGLDLCGIMAAGEILSFFGMLFFKSRHFTTRA